MRYPELPATLLELEQQTLERWREEDLFRRSMEASEGREPFVFYEGPPTSNARPGLHHVLGRTLKDLACRYQALKGRRVTRIAGWDTHGLPVEIEAEKKLGISGKPEIEAVGIERFNRTCRDSVFTYKADWEALSERIAYWLDYQRPYVTCDTSYIESVWWILSRLAKKGLLYRGHKSVPYCPRCGTALSSHEVALGYREVEDPSLFFLAPLLTEDGEADPQGRAFLAWTTTPWTVPSNVALALNPALTYAEAEVEGRRVIVAKDLVERVLGEDARIVREHDARSLEGIRYARPLEVVPVPDGSGAAWRIILEDFVTAEDGTGIVHIAPAFGADDYAAGQRHGLPLMRSIDDAGRFHEGLPLVGGMFVKDADPLLVEELDRRGNLFRAGRVAHSYPHCWRCQSPLLYIARESWFAATSTLKEEMLAINRETAWYPPEIGEGRMGEWLAGNVDWALSRDRYWGTPLPVWVCDRDEDITEWIGSLAELEERAGPLGEDFDPHRPFIDEVTWPCRRCGGTMRRASPVVDVWFDSGAMPYAQWHYPFENRERFERHFPADFISEGLDQTRGWFYSLMAISAMLGRGMAFRNVLVNDLVLDAEGRKMSKTKGNAVDPWEAVGAYGADPLRWYFVTVSNPWVPKRYDERGIAEVARKFFDTLLNTYRFFALYANVEGWRCGDVQPSPDGSGAGSGNGGWAGSDDVGGPTAPGEASLLDRWMLSRLHRLVGGVRSDLDNYQFTPAYRRVAQFVDEDLSNWYVRRSRPRYWGKTGAADADAAFHTLHLALRTVSLLIAPAAPFTADWLHRALTGGESVHLSLLPESDAACLDDRLEREMDAVRQLVTLGRAAREQAGVRVRQPLRTLHAAVPGGVALRDEVLAVLREELNVKRVAFVRDAGDLVRLEARPNFRALGPRFQRHSNAAAAAIRALGQAELRAWRGGEAVSIGVDGGEHPLGPDDLEVAEVARGDLVVRAANGFTAAIDPALDDELRAEGLARELVNRVQRLRKDSGLEVTDRIRLAICGPEGVRAAAARHRAFIAGETLAVDLVVEGEGDGAPEAYTSHREVAFDGTRAAIALARAGE